MTAPLVLFTGAAGFIGGAALAALKAAGFATRGGARRAARDGLVACDLDRPAEVEAAVRNVDVVVHCAVGAHHAMAAQTQTLLDAMARAGVANLIFLSSIAVYGAREGRNDEDALLSALDDYARGKIASEAAVAAWANVAAEPPRRAIVLRPGCVYGTGSYFWVDKLVERIRLGAWGDFGALAAGPAPLVHVEDLADLIVAASRRIADAQRGDLRHVSTLNVVGLETPPWNDYFRALAARIGAPPLKRIEPRALARRQMRATAAKLWRGLRLPGGRAAAFAATPGEIALFMRRADYPIDRAVSLLGYHPRLGIADGLARTEVQPPEKA